jgi:ubiquitin carboxyl-terminal hydrolase 6/32
LFYQGSVAAHGIMGMMNGGSKDEGAAAQQQQPPQQDQQQQYQNAPQQRNPCAYEMEDFLNCAKTQSDISLCDAFNQQFKSCQLRNGTQPTHNPSNVCAPVF